jgi:glycosyltransferase involved in cell wall biosynthesis
MKSALVCGVQAPFIVGGAEILVAELRDALLRRGFQADVASVPFKWYPPSELVRQALAFRLLDVTESNGTPVDLAIPTKFPSYLVRHPRKVCWLFHQHREVYDLYGTSYSSFTESAEDREIRDAIRRLDQTALGECRKIYTISKNVAERLRRFNQLEATPLYPPPQHLGRHRDDGLGDYLFYAGRLDRLKRLDLLVDAVARSKRARLKIAGKGPLQGEIEKQVERLGVGDRVELVGFLPAEELLSLYAGCRAALYAPVNEDYGYVTVEAFASRKPVVTVNDAGGVLEFVTDEETGLVSAPQADALAAAIDRLYALPDARVREMGALGQERVRDITWERVVDALTEGL